MVFGKANWSSPTEMDGLNGTNGFMILPDDNYYVGQSDGVWSGNIGIDIDDVDGDGYEDIVGLLTRIDGTTDTKMFIFHGKPDGYSASYSDFVVATPADVSVVTLRARANIPQGLNSSGDINGDGINDIVVMSGWNINPGAIEIYYGKATWNKGSVVGYATLTKTSISASADSSHGLAIGDINGDGFDDIAWNGYSANTMKVYVTFGAAELGGSISPGSGGTTGFYLEGWGLTDNGNNFFRDAILADVNGDCIEDLVLAPGYTIKYSFILFGQAAGWSASYDLQNY